METQGFTLPYWFDEATGIQHAKDCTACGGSGDYYEPNDAAGVRSTCGTCHGSGVMPTDECPAWVAGLILADNKRRVFNADQDWDYASEDDDSSYEGQECPVCGYDLNRSGECTGNGCGADLCS
jgi:hypothetical protein